MKIKELKKKGKVLYAMYDPKKRIECIVESKQGNLILVHDAQNKLHKAFTSVKELVLVGS